MSVDPQPSPLESAVQLGVSTLSGVVPALTGLAIPHPPVIGAMAGGVASELIREIGNDVCRRILSPRETARVGTVAALAYERIREYVKEGYEPRDDGFFSSEIRSAKELLEGVLIKARSTSQEAKLPRFAAIYANGAFVRGLDIGTLNLALELVNRLTYRNLCALAVFNGQADNLWSSSIREEKRPLSREQFSLILECATLAGLNDIPSSDIEEVENLLK